MKILEAGHIYELEWLDDKPKDGENHLVFVNREDSNEHGGTQSQEVLRALIDRTFHCHNCLPHMVNKHIIYHLRMALAYHEARAVVRKVEKGDHFGSEIESIKLDGDGHFLLERDEKDPLEAKRSIKPGKPKEKKHYGLS